MTAETNNTVDQNESSDSKKQDAGSIPAAYLQTVDDNPQCRICLAGASIENLTDSPCHCSGTMGHLHSSCLNQWLSTRDHHLCEICLHPLRSPRASVRQCTQPTPTTFVPPEQSLQGIGTSIGQPLDPIGMSMDIVAMLVIAVGFMYLGYALIQGADTSLTGSQNVYSSQTTPWVTRLPSFNREADSSAPIRRSTSSSMEVTVFCAAALFLILLSTCGNIAIQLLRVSTRRGVANPNNQRGFSLAGESGNVV
ncbi:E3 ubiquitin-protein ligase MARCH3-like [Tropilaelaps mercedesae]|uniref:E3 ubiquitin-protein ligase MARCH3-like n=1 Tax=Tropilaelaps mercedesae TaxID=418985 RepID=A0A1V9Y3A8_9ACAR|nr:E3 ubiquitin-protein ligase MARCH3-like [Tropilaelaps mercedesae]